MAETKKYNLEDVVLLINGEEVHGTPYEQLIEAIEAKPSGESTLEEIFETLSKYERVQLEDYKEGNTSLTVEDLRALQKKIVDWG
jgi:hypothetical protein